jgi:pyruvate dehydrogenase E2 component (dihydrolipoamide acetyltransferase)
VALALQRVPQANVVWGEDCLLQFKHSDVAVAVAVENGLWTPLIRQAEIKSLLAIAREMRTLIARARSGDLKPADYQGGSCSISNLGMYDVRSFSAIINPPQSAILAVGSAERRAVEGENGAPRFASLMSVTLSCDHRVIDGRLGAQFLADFKLLLQSPRLLMA